MSEAETYEKTPRSTVNRLKQRAVYDHDTIHNIINAAPVAHVSFNPTSLDDDPFPTILPMLASAASFTAPGAEETSPVAIYLHGYVSSRFMRLPTTKEDDGLPGTPVCVAATLFDGVVLSLTPFNHSCNYRSAVIHGWANLVTDPEEKLYALKLITNNLVPDRWDNARVPPTEAEMKSTSVLRVDIASASAKIRAYAPGNDKADLDDDKIRQRVWTGVVPSAQIYGEPIPGPDNLVKTLPKYIGNWVKDGNRSREDYTRHVASLPGPKKS
ncbi:hypothetical protein BDZ97DRAFT_1815797 [Flammula alnicola]|nr:hypothetical protein BDZ97DRAFT_1815797 [Flammula alnicola]